MISKQYLIIHLQREAERLKKYYPRETHKAMVHWVIRQIDPNIDDDRAFQIASRGGAGDAQIDAIWMHSDKKRLCIAQVKSSKNLLQQDVNSYSDDDSESELSIDKFDSEAVDDLSRALDKIEKPPIHPSERLEEAIQLYQQAKRNKQHIIFYPIVFGDRKTSFDDALRRLRQRFESNKDLYSTHEVIPLDLNGLIELLDKNFESPIGEIQITTNNWRFPPTKLDDGLYIALVPANALRELRQKYGIAIYQSNFRFMLGHTSVWNGMVSTLKADQEKKLFHLYHNGITILGRMIKSNPGQLTITDPQVVNGLQTIETFYDFAENQSGENDLTLALSDVFVLVRFIDVDSLSITESDGRPIAEKIAEYSNKQNPIKNRDLRSNDPVQKRLQHEIDCLGYKYERKARQYGPKVHNLVSNEKLAQYALSFWLKEPTAAKNKKALLFIKSNETSKGFYDKIFFEDVPAAALLIPYECHERIPKQDSGEVLKYGKFILLAMFGDIFMSKYGLDLPRTRFDSNRKLLDKFLTNLRDGKIDNEVNRIWKELIKRLTKIIRKEYNRRKKEAKEENKPSIRNILVNYNYKSHKRELMPQTLIRKLSAKLPRI